jgi:hypothetical protein
VLFLGLHLSSISAQSHPLGRPEVNFARREPSIATSMSRALLKREWRQYSSFTCKIPPLKALTKTSLSSLKLLHLSQ